MKKFFKILVIISTLIFVFSCKTKKATPTKSSSSNLVKPGDIIAVNTTSHSLILMDSDGNFKSILYDLDNAGESIYDVAWKGDTKEIMFTINGASRVGAISVVDGTYRNLIANPNLTGALHGLAQLKSGDIIVGEISNVERFSTDGVRRISVNGVTWPNTLGATSTTIEQLYPTADGGFIVCSSGSRNVKRYTDSAVIVGAAVVSGIVGTTIAYGCIELADGKVAVAFNGTTDTVKTLSATMTGATSIYSDLAVLGSPRTMAQALNGNLLIVDSVFNQIVEITESGTFVRTLAGGVLGTPNAVFSVPNY